MALLWFKEQQGDRYEVRSAGNSRRLYRNGVFHSQFNEARPFTGGVWDLLWLPAFFAPPETIQRVLVLGVGGGAVIRQLQRHIVPQQIIGVDLDPLHLEVAERFFAVEGAELHCADARQWLRDYRGPKFDLIIDDLFYEEDGEPLRAVEMTQGWRQMLERHMSENGMLLVNFVSRSQLAQSALLQGVTNTSQFISAFRFTLKGYQNAIGAFMTYPTSTKQLRDALKQQFSSTPDYIIRTLI